jgi:hypothetical protein
MALHELNDLLQLFSDTPGPPGPYGHPPNPSAPPAYRANNSNYYDRVRPHVYDWQHPLAFVGSTYQRPAHAQQTVNVYQQGSGQGQSQTPLPPKEKQEAKEEREEREQAVNRMTGLLVGSAMTFASTYVLSQDEYVKLCLQDTHMNYLVQNNDNNAIRASYYQWRQYYIDRTRPKLLCKIGLFLSSIAGATSIYYNYDPAFIGAVVAGTLSGSTLFWKYLTETKRQERREMNTLMNLLRQ